MFYSIDTHVLNWPKSPFPKDKKTKREKFKKTKTRKRVLYCDVRAVRDVSYDKGLFTYYVSRRRGGRGYGKC